MNYLSVIFNPGDECGRNKFFLCLPAEDGRPGDPNSPIGTNPKILL